MYLRINFISYRLQCAATYSTSPSNRLGSRPSLLLLFGGSQNVSTSPGHLEPIGLRCETNPSKPPTEVPFGQRLLYWPLQECTVHSPARFWALCFVSNFDVAYHFSCLIDTNLFWVVVSHLRKYGYQSNNCSLLPCTVNAFSTTLSSSPKDDTPPQPENEADKKILDVENDLQALQTEYKKLVTTHSQLEDKYKRALAESENMRKRFMRQVDEAKMFAVQSFCKDLLDVADVLTKATNSAPADQLVPGVNPHFTNLYEGLKLTEQQMLQVFERNHLVRIQPAEGDRFDPNFHEAVFQAPRQDGKEPNTIAVVTKVGYKLYDRPLRPAYVGVFGP
ncbi:GrpE protein 1, mitochondrial [Clonorchis sinensis]|uniref:GrpE protein homolog n=1 Tax=Clonorchis sinensis TaxID=79923 RepID=A0A3R7F7Y5_CLOSI|nr:GrpE protein 1, mitochondrial [Clonorchis sinensis]